MRKFYTAILILLCSSAVLAQRTIIADGNWNSGATWAGGNIANSLSDDVVMNNNFSVTVAGVDNFHVGNLNAGTNNALTISTGGNLELGDAGNARNLTAGTNMTITAAGTLIIWGDLIVTDGLSITITGVGQIIVKGNLIINDFSSFSVNGDLQVDGSFTAGHDTHVTVNGNISVYGPTTVGINSTVVGAGHFHTYGGCSGPPAFCATAPVKLLYFRADPTVTSVRLKWATASEVNFDYFLIEKSTDGIVFSEFTTVAGKGALRGQVEYEIEDSHPSAGISYYRLTEFDLDGSRLRLRTVGIEFSGAKLTSLFPNPVGASENLNVKLNFSPESATRITVTDLRGVLINETLTTHEHSQFPVNLKAGVYLVTVANGSYRSVTRLIVK